MGLAPGYCVRNFHLLLMTGEIAGQQSSCGLRLHQVLMFGRDVYRWGC